MVNTYGIKRNHDGGKINVNKSVNEIHLFSVVIHYCGELLSLMCLQTSANKYA